MVKPKFILATTLSALFVTLVMTEISGQPAVAQTADNLKCRGCVSSKDIKNRGIRKKDLRSDAVNGAKVRNGSLTALDLGDEPGANFVDFLPSAVLAGPPEVVQSVTIRAPRAGVVIVNASGYFRFTAEGSVRCNITTGTDSSGDGFFQSDLDAVANLRDAWGATRAFEVEAGSFTANLACEERNSGQVTVFRSHMNAMYFPTRY